MSRHLIAKMAAYRPVTRTAADEHGLDFDWKSQRNPHWPQDDTVKYHARLENGDWLTVDDGNACGQGLNNLRNNHSRWGYHLHGPTRPIKELEAENKEYWSQLFFHQNDEASEVLGGGGHGPSPNYRGETRETFINDPHGAMRAAEAHYRSLNRQGVTPSHTQNYDLDDIMRRFDRGEL